MSCDDVGESVVIPRAQAHLVITLISIPLNYNVLSLTLLQLKNRSLAPLYLLKITKSLTPLTDLRDQIYAITIMPSNISMTQLSLFLSLTYAFSFLSHSALFSPSPAIYYLFSYSPSSLSYPFSVRYLRSPSQSSVTTTVTTCSSPSWIIVRVRAFVVHGALLDSIFYLYFSLCSRLIHGRD